MSWPAISLTGSTTRHDLRLDFDGIKTSVVECHRLRKPIRDEKHRFVSWVDQVLQTQTTADINEFRVCFPLNTMHTDEINRWVEFAMSKKLASLELDFTYHHLIGDSRRPAPYHLSSDLVTRFEHNFMMSLTSLCLKRVSIDQASLESLLSRCQLLERVVVNDINELVDFKVRNSKLKYLAISKCFRMKNVEIDAVNLTFFDIKYCCGDDAVVHYVNVPSLVEASLGRPYADHLIPKFGQIASFSANLCKLSLDIDFTKVNQRFDGIPSFYNVRVLELIVRAGRHAFHPNLVSLRRFPEACPLLQELKLQVVWRCCSSSELGSESQSDEDNRVLEKWLEHRDEDDIFKSKRTLPYLKKLEWIGAFSVHATNEFPLALYIVKNAIMLDEFTCDPRHPYFIGTLFEFDNVEYVEAGRVRARKLATFIPSSINFVII